MLHLFKNFNKVKLYSLYYVSICTYMVVKNMYFKSQNKTLRVRGNLVQYSQKSCSLQRNFFHFWRIIILLCGAGFFERWQWMIVLNVFIELNKGVHIWAMVIILIPPPHQIDFVSLRTRSPFRYFLTMLPFSLTILNVLSKIWLFFTLKCYFRIFFVAKEIFLICSLSLTSYCCHFHLFFVEFVEWSFNIFDWTQQ